MDYAPNTYSSSVTLSQVNQGTVNVINIPTAGGTVTLPPATGSGVSFVVMVGTAVTAGAVLIKAATNADSFSGILVLSPSAGGAASSYDATPGTTRQISLNGTTNGGLKGDYVRFTDVAPNLWWIEGNLNGSGTLATPFGTF